MQICHAIGQTCAISMSLFRVQSKKKARNSNDIIFDKCQIHFFIQ